MLMMLFVVRLQIGRVGGMAAATTAPPTGCGTTGMGDASASACMPQVGRRDRPGGRRGWGSDWTDFNAGNLNESAVKV